MNLTESDMNDIESLTEAMSQTLSQKPLPEWLNATLIDIYYNEIKPLYYFFSYCGNLTQYNGGRILERILERTKSMQDNSHNDTINHKVENCRKSHS